MFLSKTRFPRHWRDERAACVIKTVSIALLCLASVNADMVQIRSIRVRGLADIEKSNPGEADSLLSIADSARVLSGADRLRWLEAKAVLSKYDDAARLCCAIAVSDPGLGPLACGRLMQMIEDQSPSVKRGTLASYRRCAFAYPGCDTLSVKRWLSRAYASLALFAQQDSLLLQLDTKKFPSGIDLFDAATERFSQGFVADAVFPARAAWVRLPDPSAKSIAATMLFQWYRSAARPDSASLWLTRASLADERSRVAAIAFLQSAGMIDKADSLMAGLRSAVSRDTLLLRRMLFSGDAKAAYARINVLSLPHDAFVLWKIRTALFSGNAADCAGWIDTVSFAAASEAGEEIMSYRLRLELLATARPGAMQDFCSLSYALWAQKPEKADTLRLAPCPRELRDLLASDIIREFVRLGRFAAAQAVAVASGIDSAGPELQYYYADVLIKQGLYDRGIKVLEKLLLGFPADVYAARARILLSGLRKKEP
jgi:hypothetical protein